MDRYEDHNMTGQLVGKSDIGKMKNEVSKKVIEEFAPGSQIELFGEYKLTSEANDIMICGFDNMRAREIAFDNWVKLVNSLPVEKRRFSFFQDGRLNAEQLQIFNIGGDDEKAIAEYKKEYLFSDAVVEEQDCTFKQTSHSAAMIASHMVAFLTNWVSKIQTSQGFRDVPFFFEYAIPLNLTTNERV